MCTGLKHTEAVIYALIEILHSVLFYECSGFQQSQINTISKYYLDFLLCEDVSVSYTAKLALSRALKPHAFGKNKQNVAISVDNTYKESVEGSTFLYNFYNVLCVNLFIF